MWLAARRLLVTWGWCAIIGVGFITGCASSGQLKEFSKSPVPRNASQYDVLAVNVTSDLPVNEKYIALLTGLVVTELRAKNYFKKVYSTHASLIKEYNLRLDIDVIDIDAVTSTERELLGAFAGEADMIARISLFDPVVGIKLASAVGEGHSSSGHVYAGTTPQAVQRLSEQIVVFVEKNL